MITKKFIFDCVNIHEDDMNEVLKGAIKVETFAKQAIGSNPDHRELVVFAFWPDEEGDNDRDL
jgi:hypothetical protein